MRIRFVNKVRGEPILLIAKYPSLKKSPFIHTKLSEIFFKIFSATSYIKLNLVLLNFLTFHMGHIL